MEAPDFLHPSITDIPEDDLVDQLVGPLWRWSIFEPRGVPRDAIHKTKVEMQGAPGNFRGDIDLLLCAPGRPELAVAYEVKRIKFLISRAWKTCSSMPWKSKASVRLGCRKTKRPSTPRSSAVWPSSTGAKVYRETSCARVWKTTKRHDSTIPSRETLSPSGRRDDKPYASGFLHRNPGNRAKSRSAVYSTPPYSIVRAAISASLTRGPAARPSITIRRNNGQ